MARDSTDGDPIDLDAEAAFRPEDAPIVAAFRAGLAPEENQTRRVIAALPSIRDRARRVHRRRQAVASGLMTVAVAVTVVLVVTLPGTPSASVVSPAQTPTQISSPTAKASKVRSTSLLATAAITAFDTGRLVQDDAPHDLGRQPVIAGVCVDGAPTVKSPARAWQAGWRVANPPADAIVPPGLVEKIWQWDEAGPGSALLDQLEAQVPGCASVPGLEGRGATRSLATPKELAPADRVLITAAADGQGNQAVQAVMLADDVVIQIDAVIRDAGQQQKAKLALWLLVPTLQAALTRVMSEDPAR